MNIAARSHYRPALDPQRLSPILSLMRLVKNFLMPEYGRKLAVVDRAAMAANTALGALGKGCRVVDLYLCNVSVFPALRRTNPALTIIALAVHLAQHLLSETVLGKGKV